MRFFIWGPVAFASLVALNLALASELPILTGEDMYVLAQKGSRAVRKCPQLRARPGVVMDFENSTPEIVDKTQFSELIHAGIDGKTHARPDEKPPQFEIHAVLNSERKERRTGAKLTYSLRLEVVQANEVLCRKVVRITKISARGKEAK